MTQAWFRGLVLSLALVASAGCALGEKGEKVDCTYAARAAANGAAETRGFEERGKCATLRADGSLTVHPDHLASLDFADGLASILVRGGWYYVTPAGRTAPVLTYDNGADYFEEGLARTPHAGKIGFIDRDLNTVIAPAWDFAFPFDGGSAVVCQGCRSAPVDDEHTVMQGGLWGRIDRSGAVVVPLRYERETLPPPAQ